MDSSTLFRVAPTFPIDDRRVRERRRSKIAISPVTIGSVAGATALALALGSGVTGFIALFALTALGLRWFWTRRMADIDADSLRELIAESNAEQDLEMNRIIRELEQEHRPQYAVCLARFLLLKQKIESELHKGEHRSPHAPEIEARVDGICAEVCSEITQVLERESQRADVLTSLDESPLDRLATAQRQSHASILHAYTMLYQTHAELLDLECLTRSVEVPPLPVPPAERRLDQLVDELKDEAEFISRTRERIRGSLEGSGEGGVSAPPPMVSE